jgi:hypothetical protein
VDVRATVGWKLVFLMLGVGACTTFSDLAADDDDSNGGTSGTSRVRTDGKKNGSETDVDCGGESAPKCEDGKRCQSGSDCTSGSCASGTCKAPAPDDGAKNGDETDVDCGGTQAPKCAAGKGCATNEDCATGGCGYDKKCVAAHALSCTGHFGGDTCGAGDTGAAGAAHESCCTTVTNSRGLQIGKYLVTAGRMRAFVERFGGNLQQWASTNPAGWDSRLTSQLPTSPQEADFVLGPNNKRGCSVPGRGGRTYWQQNVPPEEQSDFSKDVLDEKALNCVPWFMAAAICAYDGGRLPTHAENVAIMTNDGRNRWPWEPRDTRSYSSSQQDDRLVHRRSYATPNVAGFRMDGSEPLDRAFWVAPPGRRPTGANAIGIQDAVGNMILWTSTPRQISWTMSWEDHDRQSSDQPSLWPSSGSEEAYYAIGARCVFDR